MKTRTGTAASILAFALLMFAATASGDGEALAARAAMSGLAVDPASVHPSVPVVETLHASLIEIMKTADQLGYEGRREALAPVLSDSFDLDFMAMKSIGRSWKKLSEEEQARWLEAFERLTCANYAGRFHGHSGQAFETRDVIPGANDTMVVQTILLNPAGDDVELNYRLVETEQGWRVIDVYLDGTVSELALRRAEYSAVLKREGFHGLVVEVDRHVAKLAALN